jgi:hypothetical protein
LAISDESFSPLHSGTRSIFSRGDRSRRQQLSNEAVVDMMIGWVQSVVAKRVSPNADEVGSESSGDVASFHNVRFASESGQIGDNLGRSA